MYKTDEEFAAMKKIDWGGWKMDYNKIIIALVIILVAIVVAGFVMLNQTENKTTNNTTINNTNSVADTISQDNNSNGANEATSEPKQYYNEQGNRIVFDSNHTCHVVDKNGKTIPGSGSNYYMDGDRVVMTGQG